MLDSLTVDARYALRRLRQRPAYAILTVLTLALGTAGIGAVFGIAKRLLLGRDPGVVMPLLPD